MKDALLLLTWMAGLCAAAGCAAGSAAPLRGDEWVVESIGGVPVAAGSRVTISFLPDGRLIGSGSCNRYSGSYAVEGQRLTIGAVAATKMACAPAVMDQEQRFFEALRTAVRYELSGATALVLVGSEGTTLTAGRRVRS